jgi:hypothetical protein
MATYTAPTTRASGYLVTAANWNTDIVENIKYLKDAPTFDGAVTASSTLTVANNVGIAATKKLYLDGVAMSGDTYISESASNVLSLYSGGVESKLTSGILTVSGLGQHSFSASGTGGNVLIVRNSTAGTGNYTGFWVGNDTAVDTTVLATLSSTYTTSGPYVANGTILTNSQVGGLSLQAAHASGAIRFYSGGTTERMTLSSSGNLTVNGNITANFPGSSYNTAAVSAFTGGTVSYYSSDRRLKKNIEPIRDGLPIVRQLRPCTFDLIADDYHASGFIAQDVLGLVPGAATVTPDDGMLAFNVTGIVAFTTKAVQELDQRLTELEAQFKESTK